MGPLVIPEGMRRITDNDWRMLMGAIVDGDLPLAESLLRARYKFSESEAEAWVVAVVAAKAWNL